VSERNVETPPTIYKYLEQINLGQDDWREIVAEARKLGIELVTMCNDEPSFAFSENIGAADRYVIAAACFTEFDFIRRQAATGRPMLLRIGGATLPEIEAVVDAIRETGNQAITLLHGVQLYPTSVDQTRIAALPKLRTAFQCDVGLADHIDGGIPEAITIPALALAYGATVLEKHITTSREEKLEDFEAALGIDEFAQFVRYVRTAEGALGDGVIDRANEGEEKYRAVVRKRVVAARDLPAGHVLSRGDVAFKRADTGAPLETLNQLLGHPIAADVEANAGITPEQLAR
jgi:sialic acid synthase SpsE